jgi:hypothetical protein
MNIKTSIAIAVLAVSTAGVSACASSASKAGEAAAPTNVTGPASATTTSPATAPASSAPTTNASSNTANQAAPPRQASGQPDIPDAAMLSLADLAPSPTGSWKQYGGPPVVASQIVDPDNCDPVARPQFPDPTYPHNPAWVKMRTTAWSAADMSQVNESVITYASAVAASADFTKHRGWIAGCAAHFQWTDAPMKFSISNIQLAGVANSYGIRVAMDPPGQSGSVTGTLGIDYMTVVLRGNSLTVLSVSGASSKPQDPGTSAVLHDVQIAAGKLAAVYAPAR